MILRSVQILVAWLLASAVCGQVDRMRVERLYARSTELISAGNLPGHAVLVDSLKRCAVKDQACAHLHALLRARHLRHTGQLLLALHLLDSLAEDRQPSDPYLTYLDHYQQAKTLLDLEVYDKARKEAQRAIEAALEASLPGKAHQMELLICEAELHADDLQGALDCFVEQLTRARAEKDAEGTCRALIGLGNAYYFQEQDSAALGYYQQALEVARKHDDAGLVVSALLNIGAAITYTSGPDSALALYRAVLDTAGRTGLSPRSRADILGNMASLHSDLEQHERALTIIDTAMAIHAGLNDTASLAQAHLFKATALWHLGRRGDALEQAMLARARTRSTDLKASATKKAADILRELGRKDEALVLLEEYGVLADSLARARYNTGVAAAQVRFETAEKERRIATQQQALQLAEAEQRRKRIQRDLSIVLSAALLVVAMLLWRGLRIRRRLAERERQVHRQEVDELMHQQEMKAINAMLEGQEKERDRVARDLHDRLGSMLSAIKMQVGSLEERMTEVRKDQQDQYGKVSSLLDEAVGEVRRISHDLVSTSLSRFGLERALQDLCDSIRVSGRLEVELTTFGLEQRLERSVEIVVYRIVQELVSNALKHARATEIGVSVTRQTGRLSVMVSDDGAGFDPSTVQAGMGLGNVQGRAASIGGTVRIDSALGRGTTVSVECPVLE